MAGQSTSALGNGQSAVLTLTATWTRITASYVCSNPQDPAANAWLEGSADGTTWFPLTPFDGVPLPRTGTGARFYKDQPVNAVQAFVACSPGNTVTVTVAGN